MCVSSGSGVCRLAMEETYLYLSLSLSFFLSLVHAHFTVGRDAS